MRSAFTIYHAYYLLKAAAFLFLLSLLEIFVFSPGGSMAGVLLMGISFLLLAGAVLLSAIHPDWDPQEEPLDLQVLRFLAGTTRDEAQERWEAYGGSRQLRLDTSLFLRGSLLFTGQTAKVVTATFWEETVRTVRFLLWIVPALLRAVKATVTFVYRLIKGTLLKAYASARDSLLFLMKVRA